MWHSRQYRGGVPANKICAVQELEEKLYEISLDYRDEVAKQHNKKDFSMKMAEAYWKHSHSK